MTSTCKTTLKPGEVLNNKWIILSFIGKGGMGEVYRAHQTNLNRDVAIKVVSREWLESLDEGDEDAETLAQRFRREVQAMAQISHPNILQVFDHDASTVKKCDQDTSIEYIAMEYIPGGSLRDTMSEEGFYPEDNLIKTWVMRYFFPVLTGVMALHDNGIVHRDLKPENILMDQDIPKIADFGLARSSRLKPVTQSIEVKGSPHYMSPEHFFDFKRTDQRADVYSLGKMLFEAVEGKIKSGTTPFKSVKLTKAESPFLQELDRIIQMATAEIRDERTESVRDLLGQLERVIHGLEIKNSASKSPRPNFEHLLAKANWIWAGIFFTVLSVASMTVWHLVGEPSLGLPKDSVNTTAEQRQTEPSLDNAEDIKKYAAGNETFLSEHLGKQQIIQGGMFAVPAVASGDAGQPVEINPFYMDEFFITNQQYVDFLKHNLARITVEGGVVKSSGVNWFLLGEVRSGYEPIIYRNGEFHISDPSYASSPVMRVTGYGASAFAFFFGRRLPTDVEMLYAMVKGADTSDVNTEIGVDSSRQPQSGMMQMMENLDGETESVERLPKASTDPIASAIDNNEPGIAEYLLSAPSFLPNRFGIKGLNHEIGEWVYMELLKDSRDTFKTDRYAVIGGVEGAPEDKNSLPSVVERFPWEAFEEIGFRTAKSAATGDPEKQVKTK